MRLVHARFAMYVTVWLIFFLPAQASAQNSAQNMASIIRGLQTGSMNWNRFYPELKGVIAQQTSGTGRYDQLAQLGPVQSVIQLNGWVLPNGFFYYFRSFFQGGAVDWQVASDRQGNIMGLSFGAASQDNVPVNSSGKPATKAATPAPIDDKGSDAPSPQTKGEACSSFPGLC